MEILTLTENGNIIADVIKKELVKKPFPQNRYGSIIDAITLVAVNGGSLDAKTDQEEWLKKNPDKLIRYEDCYYRDIYFGWDSKNKCLARCEVTTVDNTKPTIICRRDNGYEYLEYFDCICADRTANIYCHRQSIIEQFETLTPNSENVMD